MSDPTDPIAEAREALAAHDHDPAFVCPECCQDVCEPCVGGLRVTLAAFDREHTARVAAEGERDEALNRLRTRPLAVCAYCAEPMPEPEGFDGTTAARVAWMDVHMRTCEEHPAGIAIRERDEARAELATVRARNAELEHHAASIESLPVTLHLHRDVDGWTVHDSDGNPVASGATAALAIEQRKHHEEK